MKIFSCLLINSRARRPRSWLRGACRLGVASALFGIGFVLLSCGLRAAQPVIHQVPVTALAFDPDGSAVLATGNRAILVYSTNDMSMQRSLPCDLPRISSFTFSPKGGLLAVGGGVPGSNGSVQLLEWKENRKIIELTNHADLVTSVAFNPDGDRLAVASSDATVSVFNVRDHGVTLSPVQPLVGHAGPVLAVAFSPDGKLIVTASADRSIKVWEASTGKLVRSFSHHTAIVHCLAFRPKTNESGTDGRPAFCASGSDDQTVRVWQPEIGRMVRIVRHHQGPIFALGYSRDGAVLFSAGKEGIVRRIDAESDIVVQNWNAHHDWIYALTVSRDGRMLATGDWSGQVKLWETETGKPIARSGLSSR
jgi:WD40 repeat protein